MLSMCDDENIMSDNLPINIHWHIWREGDLFFGVWGQYFQCTSQGKQFKNQRKSTSCGLSVSVLVHLPVCNFHVSRSALGKVSCDTQDTRWNVASQRVHCYTTDPRLSRAAEPFRSSSAQRRNKLRIWQEGEGGWKMEDARVPTALCRESFALKKQSLESADRAGTRAAQALLL